VSKEKNVTIVMIFQYSLIFFPIKENVCLNFGS